MNEDILSAGSSAKMAELCALEIYDIRDSKSLLNKGQADFMPKDGEQLRIMLANLETQENALMQLSAVLQSATRWSRGEVRAHEACREAVAFPLFKVDGHNRCRRPLAASLII